MVAITGRGQSTDLLLGFNIRYLKFDWALARRHVRGGTQQSAWEILLMYLNQRGPHVSLQLHPVDRCLCFQNTAQSNVTQCAAGFDWVRGSFNFFFQTQPVNTQMASLLVRAFVEQRLLRSGPMHRRFHVECFVSWPRQDHPQFVHPLCR